MTVNASEARLPFSEFRRSLCRGVAVLRRAGTGRWPARSAADTECLGLGVGQRLDLLGAFRLRDGVGEHAGRERDGEREHRAACRVDFDDGLRSSGVNADERQRGPLAGFSFDLHVDSGRLDDHGRERRPERVACGRDGGLDVSFRRLERHDRHTPR